MRTVTTFAAMVLALVAVAVSRVDAEDAPVSLYQLDMGLIDQTLQAQRLDLYKGHPTLVTMFYGSCPVVCPLLIDSVRATENALTAEERERVRVLLVSIDPERDTPQKLATLAKQRHIDGRRWTVAQADAEDVRLLAAALDIQYRKLPDGAYNHTSVITLLSPAGAVLKQTALLGRANPELVAALRAELQRGKAIPSQAAARPRSGVTRTSTEGLVRN